mgnify:FL=1
MNWKNFWKSLDDWGENMQIVNSNEITEGYFIRELKNRFLCEVEVDSKLAVCYVPSSCHLSNFLDLHGKRVLLIPNKSKNTRTEYSLFAVPYKRSYIILNTSMANRAVEVSIAQRRFSFLGKRKSVKKEITKGGYKWDLLIEESNTLVEIKSVISTKTPAIFPTVYSERTLKQLQTISNLLSIRNKICFLVVSLNPYIQEICLDQGTEFYPALKSCIEQGLILKGYTVRFKDSRLVIDKEIPVVTN